MPGNPWRKNKGATIDDTRMIRTIIREFAEELFNKEELVKQFEQWRDFEAHKDIKPIGEAFFWGRNLQPNSIFLVSA